MNNYNSQKLNRRLDLAGLVERVEKRDVIRKQEESTADAARAYRASFDSAYAEQRKKIRLKELAQADPALFFWLVKNRSVESA